MAPVNKKFKMPSMKYFLSIKKMYDVRKEPVWVYLEREMRQNDHLKPYNEKVGIWLKFLKELRFYKHCQQQQYVREINEECGPPWYFEFSSFQKEVLNGLRLAISSDITDQRPAQTKKILWNLGITLNIPKYILIDALVNSARDPGVFMWNLYSLVYNKSPSVLRESYDMNARLILSSIVFIDIKECIETFERLLFAKPNQEKTKKVKRMKEETRPIPYGEYLKVWDVPRCKSPKRKSNLQPRKFDYKIKLRSKESYERLVQTTEFLQKRKQRNITKICVARICKYKFWTPGCKFKNTDPKKQALMEKLDLLSRSAAMRVTTPAANNVVKTAGVSLNFTLPQFVIDTISIVPTGYLNINGGCVTIKGAHGKETVTMIQGFASIKRFDYEDVCDCLTKWDRTKQYLKDSKCRCGHNYDLFNEGKTSPTERVFSPPNKYGPLQFDEPLIYQPNLKEEMVRNQLREAMKSVSSIVEVSSKTINASDLRPQDILSVLFADLADSPLLIPHLPKANLLNSLKEWVRKRVNGSLTVQEHKKLMTHTQRRWVQLNHMDFRARAYRIPFTLTHLKYMDWAQKIKIQKMFNILLEDFTTRNRLMQMEQARMWWSTMKFDQYPSKAFLDVFFTLMPARMVDIHYFNRYDENLRT